MCAVSSLRKIHFTFHLLDYRYIARVALCHRFPPLAPDDILNRLPRCVFAELLEPLAPHLAVFCVIHSLVCFGYRESLSVVHAFLSSCSWCQTKLQASWSGP